MKIATAFVELRAERDKLKRDLDDVEGDVRKSAGSTAKAFAQVFSAAAFGAVIKGSIDAASNLNETVSKTKQLFGENSEAVIAFSKTTAQSMGLSQRAYLDGAAGLKGLLDNLGLAPALATEWSQKLTQLGADLGSFFNTDPAVAVAAIGSAMRGESEPIRQFNVNIDEAAKKQKALEMGLYSGVGAIDSNAKAQATLALIMEQTSAAQGDFARTADGAANSQRIAKAAAEDSAASLGQAFLPIYTKVVQVVTALAKGFGELPAPIQVAVVALAGLAALSGPIHAATEMVKDLSAKIKGLGPSATSAATGLGVLAATTLVALELRSRHAADQSERIAKAIDEVSRAATDAGAIKAFFDAIGTMVASGQHAGDSMAYFAQQNLEGAKRVLEVGAAAGIQKEGLDLLRAAVEEEDRARAQAVSTTEDHAAALDDANTSTAAAAGGSAVLKAATDGLARATEEAARKSDAFADALQRQLDKLDALYPKEYDAVTAKYDYADSQTAAMLAVDNLNKTLGDNKSKQEDVDRATRSARDAILDQAAKYATLDGAALGSQGAIQRQIESLSAQRDALAPGSPLRAFLDGYIADLARIPSNITSTLQLNISQGQVFTNQGDIIGQRAGARASGGPVSKGRLYEVAEGGRPEIYTQDGRQFLIPGNNGQVTPFAQGNDGAGLPPIVINNNGRDFTRADMHHVLAMTRLL